MSYEDDNNKLMMMQSVRSAISNNDNLRHISFSAEFEIDYKISRSSIAQCELDNITFTGCVFYGLFFESIFSRCKFVNCTFYNNFTRCKIEDCKFINCTFNGLVVHDDDECIPDNKNLGIYLSTISYTLFNTCTFISYGLAAKDNKTSYLFGKETELININFNSCSLPTYDELYIAAKFNDYHTTDQKPPDALFHYYFFFNDRIILNPHAGLIKLDDYLENKEYLPNELPVKLINRLACNSYISLPIEFKEKLCELIHKMHELQAKDVLETLGNK